MLTHMVALGLHNWHAFWAPIKAWADYHQEGNGNALQFFANLVTVIGLPILALLIVATLVFLISDRMDARRLRALQRRAILLGLRAELKGTRDTASQDVTAFPWTILPHTIVERALVEAGSLGLTSEQIVGLHELRLHIMKANTLVGARLEAPRGEPPGAGGDRAGREIRDQFETIAGLCDNLLDQLHVAVN